MSDKPAPEDTALNQVLQADLEADAPTAFSEVLREDLDAMGYGRLNTDFPNKPRPVKAAPEQKDDPVEDVLNGILQERLTEKNIPTEPAPEGIGSPMEVMEELGYGVVKGKEELTILNNLNDYMIVNQPELASFMGLTRRGQTRENKMDADARKIIADGVRDAVSITPMGFLAQMVGKVSSEIQEAVSGDVKMDEATTTVGMSPTKMTDAAIDKVFAYAFATQEDVAKMETEWMKENYGEDWLNLTPEQRRGELAKDADNLLATAFPDVYGTARADSAASTVGQFAGALVDPTTLLPMGGSYKAAAGIGMSLGVADASLYGLSKNGKIDPYHVALAGTAGLVLAPALKYVGTKAGGFVLKRQNMKQANKLLDKYERNLNEQIATGVPPEWVHASAQFETGLPNHVVTDLYKTTNRSFNVYKQTPAAARAALESKASWYLRSKTMNAIGRGVESVLSPVSTVMEKYSPRMSALMKMGDASQHIMTHGWMAKANPFLKSVRKIEKISKADGRAIKMHLANGNNKELLNILRRYGEQGGKFKNVIPELKAYRQTMQDIAKTYKKMGYAFDYVQNYSPRIWKHPHRMGDIQRGAFEQRVIAASKKKGGKLTSEELENITADLLNTKVKRKSTVKVSGALKQRQIDEVVDPLLDFYADPLQAAHSYIRAAAHDIARAQFVQKLGLKGMGSKAPKMNDPQAFIRGVSKSIRQQADKMGWDVKTQDRIIGLIKSRYVQGELSPDRWVQNLKNIGYINTLGNVLSTITQFGDQAFNFFKNGTLDATRGLAKAIYNQIPGTKIAIDKVQLGLVDAVEEIYSSTMATKTALNKILKITQFQRIDQLGKDALMNGALSKLRRMVKTDVGARKFAGKYARYFEGETPALVEALRRGEMTDNVKMLMWYELSDAQPIALSEMPKVYLDNPNWRMAYMLKTFTMKQFDFMRRHIFRQFAKGNVVEGTKNLAAFSAFWMMANGAADKAKSSLTAMFSGHDDFDMTDVSVDNALMLFGWSRYMNRQVMSDGPYWAALNYLAPPGLEGLWKGFTGQAPERKWEALPVVGSVISKAERQKKARRKFLRKDAASRLRMDRGARKPTWRKD